MPDPLPLLPAILFFAGGALGSFLCVCVRRIPGGLSVIKPRSYCETCGKPVAARANIPVIGFILCGGRCLRCRAPVSLFYPAVEMLCAASAVVAVHTFGFSFDALRCFVFLYALTAASAFDLRSMTVPDFITLPFAAAGILGSIPSGNFTDSVTGAAVGGGALFAAALAYRAVRKREGMGMGDVKLMVGVGAFVGAGGALLTIFAASFIGAVAGFAYLKLRGKDLSQAFPFAPFIAVCAVFFFFARGNQVA